MRRWLWRGALVIMAVLVVLSIAPTVKAFTLACNGSLEGLRYLRDVRSQIAAATAPPPTPRPTVPPTPTSPPTLTPTLTPTRPATATSVRTAPPAGAVATATQTATPSPTATLTPTATAALTPTPTPPPEPTPPAAYIWLREVAGKVAVTAITSFVRVKEADAVAYPAHVAAAYVLAGAGCGEDAVRIQWLKAGLHASRDGQPEQIARSLEARTTDADDRAQLRQIVQIWSERQPWSVPMRRVRDAFDALST
jgi:hypothetical protein